nr:putative ribonuclease H-like domain-containing protein [Tanacetum cinerariifolium]
KAERKSVDTKFEKSSVIRQPNAFKSQRPSVLGKLTTFSNSFERKDFSKSKSNSVTQNNVSNDFSKPVTAHNLPPNKNTILKNTNVIAPRMYKLHTEHNQARTSQLPHDSRKTNKRVSFSTQVIPTTSVTRPQLKSNPMGDRVMLNNSQEKKQDVEVHHRSFKFSKNKTSVTACNDSLNAKTLNVNSTLHAYFATEGILHQTSVARTPEQNEVVERQNRTLVKAARTMLSAAKVPLFFWAEAIATSYFTQNRSLVIPRHEKTPYHIINDRKPSVKFFHIFGSLCYIVRDAENLDKIKEKDKIVTTSNELDLVFSPMFDELLNGSYTVVSKSSAVSTADTPNQRQHHTTPLNNHTTHAPTCQVPTHAPTVKSTENMNQAEMVKEYAQIEHDEFINIFYTLVQDRGETLSRHVDSSNMHTFYQHHPSEHRWTKDHPLEQVIRNPSQSTRTRRQLESDGEMCMFALTVSRTEPKNIKEAMADSA